MWGPRGRLADVSGGASASRRRSAGGSAGATGRGSTRVCARSTRQDAGCTHVAEPPPVGRRSDAGDVRMPRRCVGTPAVTAARFRRPGTRAWARMDRAARRSSPRASIRAGRRGEAVRRAGGRGGITASREREGGKGWSAVILQVSPRVFS